MPLSPIFQLYCGGACFRRPHIAGRGNFLTQPVLQDHILLVEGVASQYKFNCIIKIPDPLTYHTVYHIFLPLLVE
jgi:hypothetical protein